MIPNLDLKQARAHWLSRQGLAEPLDAPLPDVLATTGWLRTLGGADGYLAARARQPGLARADVDAFALRRDVCVLPAVRGCIYLVPKQHAALVLRFAEGIWRPRAEKDIEKAGAKWEDVDDAVKAVRSVINAEGQTTDALRKAIPTGALRSFGEQGKKVGLSSPLPLALRVLEFSGEIERTVEGGRLDSERYVWRQAKRSVFDGAKVPGDLVGLVTELARIFFSQMGPATLKHFTEWAGVSQRDVRAAIAKLPLVTVSIEGYSSDALMFESELADLTQQAPAESVSFLSFEDNYLTAHGGPAVLTDPSEHHREVGVWGTTRGSTLGDAKHLMQRAIIVGGSLAGFWEYDLETKGVVTGLFAPPSKKVRQAIDERAADLARFLSEEIGHAHSFSLDTDEAVRARAAEVQHLNASKKWARAR